LDLEKFTQAKTEKVLNAFSVRESFYSKDILQLKHLKRLRLTSDVQLLAVPRYQTPKKTGNPELQDFLCFQYKSEERILSDIIYHFQDSKQYPHSILKDLISQIYFKAVLDMTVLTIKDLERLQSYKVLREKHDFIKTKKFKKKLFTIFENELEVHNIKPKDKISLSNCIVDFDSTTNSSFADQNKYKFKILVPTTSKKIAHGGKYTQHVLGCDSDELRKEWIFLLQVIEKYEGKFSMRSSMSYLD